MGIEIKNLTYSRSQLEAFTYSQLCELNGIEKKFALTQGINKPQLVEFLLIPMN